MRVISVSVGLPREVVWHGQPVLTSIFKTPVDVDFARQPSISTATSNLTYRFTGASTRRSTPTRQSIMSSGAGSCPRWNCRGEFSART